MYIDIHTHAFHPKIAHKVLAQLDDHYGIKPVGTGLAEDLKERLTRAGLNRAVVLCAATTPAQVIPANAFARDVQTRYPDTFIAFGAIHPYCEDWEDHIAVMKKAGVRGLKFHPEFQNFSLDDPALLPILEVVGEDMLVKVIEINGDRIRASRKAVLLEEQGHPWNPEETARPPRSDRGDRGDRHDRGGRGRDRGDRGDRGGRR